MLKEFSTLKGQTATIEIPQARNVPSIFVVAGHKTGSVLLSKIISDIATETDLPAIAVESNVWSQGFAIKDWPNELYEFLETPGYVFHSFRWLQKLPELKAFQTGRNIFMIRDPRDIAVSYFFSMSKSHRVPTTGSSRDAILKLREDTALMGIDDFIQAGKAGPILRNTEKFASFWNSENCIFYRYEDIIFEKRRWVAQILNDLEVSLTEDQCNAIADRHDLRPEKEDPNAHVRNVTPGGYREKLSDESIHYIENSHPAFFDTMGYLRSDY